MPATNVAHILSAIQPEIRGALNNLKQQQRGDQIFDRGTGECKGRSDLSGCALGTPTLEPNEIRLDELGVQG